MKIHEFQAKEILKKFNVRIPRSRVATLPEEVYYHAKELGGKVVVKAQIHAGGRGKGGGVKLAKSPAEAEDIARKMLGTRLVTHQTGPEGKMVRKVLVEEALHIKKEYYLGIVIDRSTQRPVFMASSEGGMEIEDVAARNPDAIKKEYIDPRSASSPTRLASSPSASASRRRPLTRPASSSWPSTRPSPTWTPRWPRSTRSSRPRRATTAPSTPRSTSTTTPSSGTPT